jgi:hypothetical protein
MGKHTAFNRAVGPLRFSARCAAEALALRLPEAPLPPALPLLPLTAREVAWLRAILAAADAAALPGTEDDREALRAAVDGLGELMPEAEAHPMQRRELHALPAAVPLVATAGTDPVVSLAAAVAAGVLTASQAAHWRFRLGLVDGR